VLNPVMNFTSEMGISYSGYCANPID